MELFIKKMITNPKPQTALFIIIIVTLLYIIYKMEHLIWDSLFFNNEKPFLSETKTKPTSACYPLPPWVSTHVKANYNIMSMYDVPGDGDCLFKSVQIILASIGQIKSINELRQIVASPVLNEQDEMTNKTIENWIKLYHDALAEENIQLLVEYRHVACVGNDKDITLPLTMENRKKLYFAMLEKSYWGEQHACRVLEEYFKMRFLIIHDDIKRPSICWYHTPGFTQQMFGVLYLSGQHYSPVSINEQFIYKWDEFPLDVAHFFAKAYEKFNNK